MKMDQFEMMERLVRRRTRHLEFTAKTGELNIVPYLDIMVNLIMFMLVTITSSVSLSVLGVSAPRYSKTSGGATAPQRNTLRLTVLVSLKGFFVSMRGSFVTADGRTLPKGTPRPDVPTIPKVADKYNYAALTELAAKVKDKNEKETRAILVADYRVEYDVIVKVMDALRSKGPRKLFGDVYLGTL